MKRKFDYISVPAGLWLNKRIKGNQKLVFAEINSLDTEKGCFANNAHFAEMFSISKSRVSEIIGDLKRMELISIEYEDRDGKMTRILHALPPFGTSNPPSADRTPPSADRRPPSADRTPLYNVLEKQLENQERDAHVISFLYENYTSALEAAWMKMYRQVKRPEKFWADFEDKCQVEKLPYDSTLINRLWMFYRNWVDVQERITEKEQKEPNNIGQTFRANGKS